MKSLFTRKPISELLAEEGHPNSLKRELGPGGLVMLAIGAVIGAGIFSSIGTAAAGEVLPSGEVVRYGAGPALVISFILLGTVCALAGLCYAELAAMIPQAGSAYAYTYATLGELVAGHLQRLDPAAQCRAVPLENARLDSGVFCNWAEPDPVARRACPTG